MVKWKRNVLAVAGLLALALVVGATAYPSAGNAAPADQGIHKIKHVIVIMQENRSFDHYFGTFPGADGFPTKNGAFSVCVNDPRTGKCVYPFHDASDKNQG